MMSRFRLIFSLIACSLLSGCGVYLSDQADQTSTVSKPQNSVKRQTISAKLRAWNNQKAIRLQDHQLIPIDYLDKNPQIKGLIINHGLGTGKTYLAIGLAEKNTNHPVIILGPKFLQAHWLENLDKYGVKDKTRYRFLSYDEPEALVNEDLSNSIVILDESHRFIEKVRLQSQKSNLYSRLYLNIQKAHKVLGLTGTPIYNNEIDLMYQINLVAGKTVVPVNNLEFRQRYSKINVGRAYWRGHILESLCLPYIFSAFSSIATPYALNSSFLKSIQPDPQSQEYAVFKGRVNIAMKVLEFATLSALKFGMPIHNFPLRSFDVKQLKEIMSVYISCYDFKQDTRFYPSRFIYQNQLTYNDGQLNFLYRLYDSQLSDVELAQVIQDSTLAEAGENLSIREYIHLNNDWIQNNYKKLPGAGREVGNLAFKISSPHQQTNKKLAKSTQKLVDTQTIYPDKFECILATIRQSQGPVVVYSHYYYNGLLLFKQFLDASGYKDAYRVFHPEFSKEQHTQIIQEFNANQVKILLLHPDITEGISLQGTRQLHFLEMPINRAVEQQIIGRTVRYKSHLHLPKHERKVEVYFWQYTFPFFSTKQHIISRKTWHFNHAELNYYSGAGLGRLQLDESAILKFNSPDTWATLYLNRLNSDMEQFKKYAKNFSIENVQYKSKHEER